MNKRLGKALAVGMVPCAICGREHAQGARTISHGVCVNGAACGRRVATSLGRFPKFVSLGLKGGGWPRKGLLKLQMEAQERAYREHMEQHRFMPETDLYVA